MWETLLGMLGGAGPAIGWNGLMGDAAAGTAVAGAIPGLGAGGDFMLNPNVGGGFIDGDANWAALKADHALLAQRQLPYNVASKLATERNLLDAIRPGAGNGFMGTSAEQAIYNSSYGDGSTTSSPFGSSLSSPLGGSLLPQLLQSLGGGGQQRKEDEPQVIPGGMTTPGANTQNLLTPSSGNFIK